MIGRIFLIFCILPVIISTGCKEGDIPSQVGNEGSQFVGFGEHHTFSDLREQFFSDMPESIFEHEAQVALSYLVLGGQTLEFGYTQVFLGEEILSQQYRIREKFFIANNEFLIKEGLEGALPEEYFFASFIQYETFSDTPIYDESISIGYLTPSKAFFAGINTVSFDIDQIQRFEFTNLTVDVLLYNSSEGYYEYSGEQVVISGGINVN